MEQALAEFLLNALWQLPLLAGSAWLLVRLFRPAPQLEHCIWLTVLALGLILPLHGTPAALTPPPEHLMASAAPAHGMPGTLRLGPDTTRWMIQLYLASVAVALARIAWAWRSAGQLVAQSSETCLGGRSMAAFEEYGRRLGVKLPQLQTSSAVSSPMVVGLWTAALLLPENFAAYTENEIRAALCHELAHVARRDYLVNLTCEVVAVPLAWHPAVHEVLQRIRTTREMVCDAMAAEEMKSQIGYAKCLLAMAHSMVGEHGIWMGLFSKHTLEERVMQLTETTTTKARAGIARVAAGLAVMIATSVIATTFHVTPTMAQASPAPSPTLSAPAPELETPAEKPRLSHPRVERKKLTPEQKLRLKQEMENAHQQMARATQMLNSPEFKKQMEDIQQQMAKLNSPEFKQQVDEAAKQMAKAAAMLDNPDFKQKMEDAQRQMKDMDEKMRDAFSPDVWSPIKKPE